MRTDFPQFSGELTVAEAMNRILQQQPAGRIIYFYVTDAEGRLIGVVPTRRLLLSPRDTRIDSIMVKQVIAVPHTATVLDSCEFFILHKLLAFPILDDDRRIIGMVDVDLYTTELQELERRESTEDLFQLIGVHITQSQQRSPMISVRKRFPWLIANMAGGILAAFLSSIYEVELQKVVALALFIPVVLALAESVSVQSVTLALQTLHGQRPTWKMLREKLGREFLTGAVLGLLCASLVGVVALIWIGQTRVALCIFGGILAGVVCAAIFGLAIPNILRILSRDPQVAAGPIALATADMATLVVYFNLARQLLS
jgi:magnesium transporter